MNKSNLKRYAPAARRQFIAAVAQRAQLLGLSLDDKTGRIAVEPCQVHGDVAVIAGRAWPAVVARQRDALYERMVFAGHAATLEAVAYTWFNRLAALRYLELHDYLGHGRRVLSHPDGSFLPEVLAHAMELAEAGSLPGLRPDHVRELKLANQDGELYRRVLLAQCNALNTAMPFLFEALDDETELLLPDNLLLSDSIVAKLVAEIPEEDWTEVEAIGWLYQFYISEKKDEVIGKVVKSEDIPAATQLFTPNWIVQYLVQNSVGRLWLMANPTSTLASQWPYYIQPAEQTPEVQAQLNALIQTRIRENGEALNPETITVLDPACGSGHILVVAYDVLKAIYLERGYQPRTIPRLILEKNLYGLDIDDRAAQLAAFALLMKARADDRRLFNDPPKLNVLSLQESKGLDADELATHLAPFGLQRAPLKALVDTFEHAKTFGSLIQIPAALNGQLAAMTVGLQQALRDGDLYAQQAAKDVLPLVWQALVLGMQFDAVVANPPYMGGKGMNQTIKYFARKYYSDSKSDLFAMFIERGFAWCKPASFNSMVTMQSWMFLSSFETMREKNIENRTIYNFIQIGYNSFPEINSKIAQACAFNFISNKIHGFNGRYVNLNLAAQSANKDEVFLNRKQNLIHDVCQDVFKKITGSPMAYWLGSETFKVINESKEIKHYCDARQGLSTGDADKFIRLWPEVSILNIAFGCKNSTEFNQAKRSWAPYNKGGEFRKYYGNQDYVVLWENNGEELKNFIPNSVVRNEEYFFRPAISWSDVTSSHTSFRYYPTGFIFDTVGHSAFFEDQTKHTVSLGYLNGKFIQKLIPAINPTLHFSGGYFFGLPYLENWNQKNMNHQSIDA